MGAGVTAPVLGDGSASFTPGISERRGSTSSFYGSDYLGTNSALYSSGETVSATRQYDAFGNLTSSSGSSANPFGFAGNWGYQNDSDSGLMLLGHRYYDASTGRFLTRDPIKDGRNWYAYCGNNPIGAVDPLGLCSLTYDYGFNFLAGFIGAGGSVGLHINFASLLDSGVYIGGGTDIGVGLFVANKHSLTINCDPPLTSGGYESQYSGLYTPAGTILYNADGTPNGVGTPAVGIGYGASSRWTHMWTLLDAIAVVPTGTIVDALLRITSARVFL
jgi:RHS repeat-associated protein